jgi:hypothetical protein
VHFSRRTTNFPGDVETILRSRISRINEAGQVNSFSFSDYNFFTGSSFDKRSNCVRCSKATITSRVKCEKRQKAKTKGDGRS